MGHPLLELRPVDAAQSTELYLSALTASTKCTVSFLRALTGVALTGVVALPCSRTHMFDSIENVLSILFWTASCRSTVPEPIHDTMEVRGLGCLRGFEHAAVGGERAQSVLRGLSHWGDALHD
jgi:hypothetical protein